MSVIEKDTETQQREARAKSGRSKVAVTFAPAISTYLSYRSQTMFPCSNRAVSNINRLPDKPLFRLGKLVATRGAVEMLKALQLTPFDFVNRHWQGDWGDLDKQDCDANEEALRVGARLLSSYHIDASHKLWIITEADRASTTLLLPEEY